MKKLKKTREVSRIFRQENTESLLNLSSRRSIDITTKIVVLLKILKVFQTVIYYILPLRNQNSSR